MTPDVGHGGNSPDALEPASSAPAASPAPIDLNRFGIEVRQVLESHSDEVEGAVAAVRFLLGIPGAYAAAYFRRGESLRLRPASPLICHNQYADRIRGHESCLVDAVDRMIHANGPIIYPLGDASFDAFLYPLGEPANITGAIALFADVVREEVDQSPLLIAAGLVAGELSRAHRSSTEFVTGGQPSQQTPVASIPEQTHATGRHEPQIGSLEQNLADELLAIKNDETTQAVCHRIANRLEDQLGVSQVMLGISDRKQRRCKLHAISGMATFASHSPLVAQVEELMAEAMLHDAMFEADSESKQHELTSAEQGVLSTTDADRIVHGPLIDSSGGKIGAWIVVEHPDNSHRPNDAATFDRVVAAQPAVAGAISLVRKLQRSSFGKALRKMMLAEDDIAGRRRFWQMAVAITLLMLIPLPNRVGCDTELFPVTHRFVPAPYEGVLKEVLVEPGDVVKQGQVLARMDAK